MDFDPEFKKNGLFYTVHTEEGPALNPKVPQTKVPDLSYPENTVTHGVVIEWKAADPTASTFSGTRREVLRLGFADTIHGIQQIGFNPTSQPGDQDYGLLYIAAGDGGVVGEGSPGKVINVLQDLRVLQGKNPANRPAGHQRCQRKLRDPGDQPLCGQAGRRPERDLRLRPA